MSYKDWEYPELLDWDENDSEFFEAERVCSPNSFPLFCNPRTLCNPQKFCNPRVCMPNCFPGTCNPRKFCNPRVTCMPICFPRRTCYPGA